MYTSGVYRFAIVITDNAATSISIHDSYCILLRAYS